MMKVSVIMPCYNHGEFLMQSVQSILWQTHKELELIIIDDYSTDDSWAVTTKCAADDVRIRPIRHEQNRGLSRSRNDGLQAATGEFIAFCDSDDIWEPEKLSSQLTLLEENPQYDVVYCDTLIIDGRGTPTGQRFTDLYPLPKVPSGALFAELVRRNFINIQSVMLRRGCVQAIGPFDEQIELVQDWWYWVRLSRQFRFLYWPKPLARYRVHARSTNLVQQRGYCVNRFRVFRRMLREYGDLSRATKANIVYQMGTNLCMVGKCRLGRRLLWDAVGLSLKDPRAFSTLARSCRRIILSKCTT